MKQAVAATVVLALILSLAGCAGTQQKYQITYLDLFDTVTQITGMTASEAEFQAQAAEIHRQLLEYHQLFDIYNSYEEINNLKTVNDRAGAGPVAVDAAIVALLQDCRDYWTLTGGRVNAAMGSVLQLWHEAREASLADPDQAALPDADALAAAAAHCSWDTVLIDPEAGTVELTDPDQRLDVGAIAKGWALQRVAETLPEGYLISLGGNVCATGPKDTDGTPWTVAVNDPDGDGYLQTLSLVRGSAVTSGDYQRYFTVDGINYHHIIDPDTLMPGTLWRSVTVLCADSGLADALSTALFLLSQEEGQRLLEQCSAEALWVDAQGNCFRSPGFGE